VVGWRRPLTSPTLVGDLEQALTQLLTVELAAPHWGYTSLYTTYCVCVVTVYSDVSR
jgi:hypothetical protein